MDGGGGPEIQGRSFLAAILPKVLAWRARQAAGLGPEHEVLITTGRAVLVAPRAAREAVVGAIRRDARAILDGTADTLAVDVAWCDLQEDALEARSERSFGAVLEALLDRGIDEARLRRADGAPEGLGDLWTPEHTTSAPLAAFGRRLRTSEGRAAAIGVAAEAEASAHAVPWAPLGITVAAGRSVEEVAQQLAGPRLLLRIDGLDPDSALEPGDEVAELPLTGAWTRAEDGVAQGPRELTAREARLGALRLDLDGLARALHDVTAGKPGADGLRDRLALSEAVALACGPIADAATWSVDGPRDVQWIAAGGDLLLLGAWSELVEVAPALREALAPGLRDAALALGAPKAAQGLDVSAGLATAPAGVPLMHLAARAAEELRRAKGERRARTGERRWKKAICWGGVAVGWQDFRLVVELGGELSRAIQAGEVRRGFVRRLAGIHTLFRRHEEALDAGATREAAAAAKRRWVWAYQLGQAQAGQAPGETGASARLVARLSKLALEDTDEGPGGARRTEQEAAAWLGLVAEIAHRRTRARRKEHG